MTEIKTLGDVWKVLDRHGLKSDYCPHCDQFEQAKALQKQDELIADLYEALKEIRVLAIDIGKQGNLTRIFEQIDKALSKAKGE